MSTHPGLMLHAYLDNELDTAHALEVHRHLEDCAACRSIVAATGAAQKALRLLPDTVPSAALAARLRPARARRPRVAIASAAAMLAAALVFFVVLPGDTLDRELASAHARALVSSHVIDVVSSDRHTVKPYFQGKVPFSLPVADFADQGFKLEGGRVDSAGGRTTAVLVYRYREHYIDVFAWPNDQRSQTRGSTQLGYHLLQYDSEGLHFALVSDASEEVLRQLAALIR